MPPDPTSPVPMLDEAVVQRVLGVALRTGGDFAEVFAEERRSSSARLDDGKVEELTSGRSRGVGIRVVVGDTTGFAHTSDLSESGL
ncbi:MAG: TldD protein, partial [Actinomycetota bacterium]|nr:TldD protein [Actinomycetota bacterium]